MSEPSATVRAPRPSAVTAASSAGGRTGRSQIVLLAALTAVLGGLVVFVVLPAITGRAATPVTAAPPAPPRPAAPGRAETTRREVVGVRLGQLGASVAEPTPHGRNLFRMGSPPAPPGSDSGTRTATPAPAVPVGPVAPSGPPPPPPLPPIPYRFIGIVTAGGQPGKIAVLSDGKNVFSGREGAIVDGRYRIVRIGEESIQMEYVDGRGRQTIRLTGQ